MARTLTLRKAVAAITMALASLCGVGKVQAEQKGTLSIVEIRSNAALRPDIRKRTASFLQNWLALKSYEDVVVRERPDGQLAVWSTGNPGALIEDASHGVTQFGLHEVVRRATEADLSGGPLGPGHALRRDQDGSDAFVIKRAPLISNTGIAEVSPGFGYDNYPVINFRLTPDAAAVFASFTRRAVGEPFAIVIDDEVLSAPVIREPITGGSGQISGNFTTETATALALSLEPFLADLSFVVRDTCFHARPRAPPKFLKNWFSAELACD